MPDITDFDMYIGAGVGKTYNLSDDYSCMKHFGITNYKIFDATTEGVPDDADPNYIRKNIGIENTDTLTNLVQEVGEHSNVLLKMDIENCEWNWINCASLDLLSRFKLIVIEMHFVCFPEEIGDHDVDMFEKFAAVKKLSKTHRLIHAHGNNYSPQILEIGPYKIPSVCEFTFVRKHLATDEFSDVPLPIEGLDFKNDSRLPDKCFLNIHAKTR